MTSQGIPSAAAEAHPPTPAAACVGAPQLGASQRPPSCNTGGKITDAIIHVPRSMFGVHWLQGTTEAIADDLVEDFSNHLAQTNWEVRDRGSFGYRASYVSSDGVQVHFNPSTAEMPASLVVVPGEVCETLGWERLRLLAMWGLKLTRVDLAFDHGDASPRTFRYFWLHGYARSRIRRSSCSYHESPDGTSFYIGAPGGTHRLVVYDRRGFNRAELRLKGKRAHAFLERGAFLGSLTDARMLGLGFLRDLIDFVDPASEANMSRRVVLGWWQRWLEGAARAYVAMPPRPSQRLARALTWLRTQAAPTIAAVVEHFGAATLAQLVREGYDRRGRRGLRALAREAAAIRARARLAGRPEFHSAVLAMLV